MKTTTESIELIIVEDDRLVQQSLVSALRQLDAVTTCYCRPSEVLSVTPPMGPACMVVDLCLPEMTGLELLTSLRTKGWRMPFVVISGYADIAGAVEAMQLGALHFLEKPIDESALRDVVAKAIDRDREQIAERQRLEGFVAKLSTLTPRETDVLKAVVQGRMNKQMAGDLGVSIKTVETHRGNLTRKLEVDSIAQLVRLMVESADMQSQ